MRIALYLISLLLWLVLIHVELRNCPVPGNEVLKCVLGVNLILVLIVS